MLIGMFFTLKNLSTIFSSSSESLRNSIKFVWNKKIFEGRSRKILGWVMVLFIFRLDWGLADVWVEFLINIEAFIENLHLWEIWWGVIHKWCHGFRRGSAICDALLNFWEIPKEKRDVGGGGVVVGKVNFYRDIICGCPQSVFWDYL